MKQPGIEVYLVTDVESLGPNPVEHSMLSMGVVAMLRDGTVVDEWYSNFELREGTAPDQNTLEFWGKHTRAYNDTRVDPVNVDVGMENFYNWLNGVIHHPQFEGKKVLVVPASMMHGLYDGWFLMHHIFSFGPKKNLLSKRYINIPDLAHAVMGGLVNDSAKRFYPAEWFKDAPQHDHDALHDARGEAVLLANIFKAIDSRTEQHGGFNHAIRCPACDTVAARAIRPTEGT